MRKLAAARLYLAHQRPYISAALWALHPIEEPGLGTLAVDRWWRLYYDPAAVERWSVKELAGVLYHEVWHLLRAHSERAEKINADPRLWNVAADAEINDDILVGEVYPLDLPHEPITPRGMGWPPFQMAEEYYRYLQEPARPDEQAPARPEGDLPTRPQPAQGSCGSCAHGKKEGWERGEPGEETPGVGAIQAEAIRKAVAQKILEVAEQSRGAISGNVLRWAKGKLAPAKVDWRRELATLVRQALASQSGATDYTHSRINRRQACYNPVLIPSLCQPIPEVAIVVDTSGSMSDSLLLQALAEIKGVLQSLGKHGVTVLAVDSSVNTCRRVFQLEQVDLFGGGGTDMVVGIEAALQCRPRPQVVVVLTDGFTPWPKTAPRGVKVIVGLMGGEHEAPKWAKVVKVEGRNDG